MPNIKPNKKENIATVIIFSLTDGNTFIFKFL
jgi:hypothetical protein